MKKILICIVAGLMLLTGCSGRNDVAMLVGDVEVKNEYIDYFQRAFNTQSGGTVSSSVNNIAKNQAELYAKYTAIGQIMKLDVEPVYQKLVDEFLGDNGDLNDFLDRLGISKSVFDFVMYGDAYSDLLLKECKNEINVTSESEDEYFINNYWRAKHLLLLTEGKSGEEVVEIKSKIDSLYDRVKNGEDFDALIQEYNEDPGVESNPDGYIFKDGDMVIEFQDGVQNIEVGEYNLVKTSYGYHIVKRLAIDETPELYKQFKESKRNEIDQALVGEIFMDYVNSKIDEYKIQTLDYTRA